LNKKLCQFQFPLLKEIKINNTKPFIKTYLSFSSFYFFITKYSQIIVINVNIILTVYLLIQNNRTNKLIKHILNNYSINIKDVINSDKYENNFSIDKDMIGLKYPEILFDKIKTEYN